MNLNEYQQACLRTWNTDTPTYREPVFNAVLGLAGEVGEVAELVKKTFYHGRSLDAATIAAELGDVLYYLAVTAHEFGLNLDEIGRWNVAKLQARHPNGFDPAYHNGEVTR